MSFYEDGIAAALPVLRAAALERMTDTAVIQYRTGRTAQNETTGAEDPIYATRFTAPCRIQDAGLTDQTEVVAGRREVDASVQIHLPWDVAEVQTGDRITITAIGPTTPARLLGKAFIVGVSADKSMATATRLNVKEASS